MNGEKILPATLFIALGLAFWKAQPPGQVSWVRPRRFVGVALVWTVLGVLAAWNVSLAAAFGVGIDLMLAILPGKPGQPLMFTGTTAGAGPLQPGPPPSATPNPLFPGQPPIPTQPGLPGGLV